MYVQPSVTLGGLYTSAQLAVVYFFLTISYRKTRLLQSKGEGDYRINGGERGEELPYYVSDPGYELLPLRIGGEILEGEAKSGKTSRSRDEINKILKEKKLGFCSVRSVTQKPCTSKIKQRAAGVSRNCELAKIVSVIDPDNLDYRSNSQRTDVF